MEPNNRWYSGSGIYRDRSAKYSLYAVERVDKSGLKVGKTPWMTKDNISSWTWPGLEEKETTIDVYSDAPEVEVFLNGKSLGRKEAGEDTGYVATYKIEYESGELKAIAWTGEKNSGGDSRGNMVTYILGGNEQNGLQMIYLMVAMQPIAIGAVVVPILANKFGERKIVRVSSVITVIGVATALINPYNFGIAVAGGMVFSCGIFAVTNMYLVFPQQANDVIEYKHGETEETKYQAKLAKKAAKKKK